MKILVTGAAGFIGFHLVKRLIERGEDVVGLDSINDYYDVRFKYGRLAECGIRKEDINEERIVYSSLYQNYHFIKLDLTRRDKLHELFTAEKFDIVCNLAAQAGVRYSLENPYAYVDSNIVGFVNILEGCRGNSIKHLVYASSSSVYGLNEKMPFSTSSNVDHPISLYAASKKANELMAHNYSYLFNLPTTGLRFFTVYGPWGRPDMALFLFTKAMLAKKPINIFNYGKMRRDFTYVDDIVEGIVRVIDSPPDGNKAWSGLFPEPSSSIAPYKVYNIGNGKPVELMWFVETIEKRLGVTAKKNFLPMQDGDVPATWADTSDLESDLGYKPSTAIEQGVSRFIDWYLKFYA